MIVFHTSVWYIGSLLSQSYELSQENFSLSFIASVRQWMLAGLPVVIISQYIKLKLSRLHILNLYRDVCQLFLSKTGGGGQESDFRRDDWLGSRNWDIQSWWQLKDSGGAGFTCLCPMTHISSVSQTYLHDALRVKLARWGWFLNSVGVKTPSWFSALPPPTSGHLLLTEHRWWPPPELQFGHLT